MQVGAKTLPEVRVIARPRGAATPFTRLDLSAAAGAVRVAALDAAHAHLAETLQGALQNLEVDLRGSRFRFRSLDIGGSGVARLRLDVAVDYFPDVSAFARL